MPLTLTENEVTSIAVSEYKITQLTIDIDDQSIAIRVLKSDDQGNPIAYENYTVEGADFQPAVVRANELAGGNVYDAIKQSLYESIRDNHGKSGTIA